MGWPEGRALNDTGGLSHTGNRPTADSFLWAAGQGNRTQGGTDAQDCSDRGRRGPRRRVRPTGRRRLIRSQRHLGRRSGGLRQDVRDGRTQRVVPGKDVRTFPIRQLILNLCRVLAFLKEDLILSRNEGGVWGINHLPDLYVPLVQAALLLYTNTGSMLQMPESPLFAASALLNYAEYMKKEIFFATESLT